MDSIKQWSNFLNNGTNWKSLPSYALLKYQQLLTSSATILDLGAGNGRNIKPFLENGNPVLAVDQICSIEMQHLELEYTNLQFKCIDLNEFHFETKFHLVIFSNVLQFLNKSIALELFKKAFKNLEIGGFLYYEGFNKNDPSYTYVTEHYTQIEPDVFYNSSNNDYLSFLSEYDFFDSIGNKYILIFSSQDTIRDYSHGTPHYHSGLSFLIQKIS